MNDTKQMTRQNETAPERLNQGDCFSPAVDILENDGAFVFHVDLPGVKPEETEITYENNLLTIHARTNSNEERKGRNFLWQEYSSGNYFRQFSLSTAVDADKIEAKFADGVLELTLPKAQSAKPRKIQIQSN